MNNDWNVDISKLVRGPDKASFLSENATFSPSSFSFSGQRAINNIHPTPKWLDYLLNFHKHATHVWNFCVGPGIWQVQKAGYRFKRKQIPEVKKIELFQVGVHLEESTRLKLVRTRKKNQRLQQPALFVSPASLLYHQKVSNGASRAACGVLCLLLGVPLQSFTKRTIRDQKTYGKEHKEGHRFGKPSPTMNK